MTDPPVALPSIDKVFPEFHSQSAQSSHHDYEFPESSHISSAPDSHPNQPVYLPPGQKPGAFPPPIIYATGQQTPTKPDHNSQLQQSPYLPPDQHLLPENSLLLQNGYHDNTWLQTHSGPRVDNQLAHNGLEASFQEQFRKIATGFLEMAEFLQSLSRNSRKQLGGQFISEGLPGELNRSVAQSQNLTLQLEKVRDDFQQLTGTGQESNTGRTRGGGHDGSRGVNIKVKKRRGHAASSGRCHSCNRTCTPEWRRGPDGARTLCNACGLHYAKLERKRQLEALSQQITSARNK